MLNPDLNDYQLTSIITECCGGMAVVYSAQYKPTDKNVAIKRYFVDNCKEKANLIQQDILTRKELQHPNILPYLTSFVHGRELYVVSPLMTFGSCRDILDRYFQEGLPELACALILRDTLLALQYLHKQLYIHRSVRASHILIGADGNARLSGLRSAASLMVDGRRQRHLYKLPPPDHDNSNLMWLSPELLEQIAIDREVMYNNGGERATVEDRGICTIYHPSNHDNSNFMWVRPELLEQNLRGYDERSDVYSLGVAACELGNGAVPFLALGATLMFTEKVRAARPQLLDCTTCPVLPQAGLLTDEKGVSPMNALGDSAEGARLRQRYAQRKFSDSFHQLTDVVLQRDPEKRPSATQLLNHAFFKQIRKTDYLPGLIGRVKPIKPDPNDMSALLLQEQMADMDIEKTTEWDF